MRSLTGQGNPEPDGERAARPPERRIKARYPLTLDLVFRRRGEGGETAASSGKTVNISSGGILFEADSSVGIGDVLQLAIRWPAKLENRCAIKVIVSGKVVRCSESQTAIEILQHEFRTAGNNGLTV
jgi:PilZ domain